MISNSEATLFIRTADGFEKQTFSAVYVKEVFSHEAESGGVRRADEIKIRIPTDVRIDIKCGDYAVTGISGENTPPADAYVIREVCDNRSGSFAVRHYKLTAVR